MPGIRGGTRRHFFNVVDHVNSPSSGALACQQGLFSLDLNPGFDAHSNGVRSCVRFLDRAAVVFGSMRRRRQGATRCLGRGRWALALCLLVALSAILHIAHPSVVEADPSKFPIVSASDGFGPCDLGYTADGKHCQPTNPCPLCAPVSAAITVHDDAATRPTVTVAALVSPTIIRRHFHPPRFPLQA